MRLCTCLKLGLIFSLILLVFYFYSTKSLGKLSENEIRQTKEQQKSTLNALKEKSTGAFVVKKHEIVLVTVACGDRLQETLTMIKSAIVFSKEKINFIIFTQQNLIKNFTNTLTEWRDLTNNAFNFNIRSVNFPSQNADEWIKLFKPCSAQRLFLPGILTDIDSVLYMDTDTVFLTPVESVWEHFYKMNTSQMVATAAEHEDPNVAWYNRFARHPFYPPLGVNTGVMLMNLTRLRQFQWLEYLAPVYKKYKLKLTWGDQDIINIIFHYHPEKLYLLPCRLNFRSDQCMYTNTCKAAEKDGVGIVHGSRGVFYGKNPSVFGAVHRTFKELQIGSDLNEHVYQTLKKYFEDVPNKNCGLLKHLFLKNLKTILNIDNDN